MHVVARDAHVVARRRPAERADPIAVDADRPEGADGGDVSGGGGEPLTAVAMSCCTSEPESARS